MAISPPRSSTRAMRRRTTSLTPIVAAGAQDNGTSRSASLDARDMGGDPRRRRRATSRSTRRSRTPSTPSIQNGDIAKTTNANAGTAIAWTRPCRRSPSTAPVRRKRSSSRRLPSTRTTITTSSSGAAALLCETKDGGATRGTVSNNSRELLRHSSSRSPSRPPSSAVLYAGTDGGSVSDRTTNWQHRQRRRPGPGSATAPGCRPHPVTSLAVDRANPNTALRHLRQLRQSGTSSRRPTAADHGRISPATCRDVPDDQPSSPTRRRRTPC